MICTTVGRLTSMKNSNQLGHNWGGSFSCLKNPGFFVGHQWKAPKTTSVRAKMVSQWAWTSFWQRRRAMGQNDEPCNIVSGCDLWDMIYGIRFMGYDTCGNCPIYRGYCDTWGYNSWNHDIRHKISRYYMLFFGFMCFGFMYSIPLSMEAYIPWEKTLFPGKFFFFFPPIHWPFFHVNLLFHRVYFKDTI
jgi:hypothetical protein